MQVDTLEQAALERANSGAHIAIQELQQQLNQANHLLVERQSQWEHSGAERGARILTLERQLAHVRRPTPPPQTMHCERPSANGQAADAPLLRRTRRVTGGPGEAGAPGRAATDCGVAVLVLVLVL